MEDYYFLKNKRFYYPVHLCPNGSFIGLCGCKPREEDTLEVVENANHKEMCKACLLVYGGKKEPMKGRLYA